MRSRILVIFLLGSSFSVQAGNEIGPEGHKLIYFAIIAALTFIAGYLWGRGRKRGSSFPFRFLVRDKVNVELIKDRVNHPQYLELIITNKSDSHIDIDSPLLILGGWWYRRKFKLKGTNKNWIYPLYLMKDQSHTLNIDLQRFYGFDRTLKQLPSAKVVVRDVRGHVLGSRKVLLRKTLFNF